MSLLRVDMHTHTEYSKDSRTTLRAYAAGVERAGLHVVCVTDHDRIDGALQLREMALPFRVVVGEEISSRDGEIIGLFLERPVPPRLSGEETAARVHEQGGVVYVPHPFSRNRLRHVRRQTLERLVPHLDAIEVFNAREAFAGDNRRAYGFAATYALPGGAGSDAHRASELGRAYVEVAEFTTALEFLEALREGQVSGKLSGIGVHVGTRYDMLRKWLSRRRR